jgi:hypothetical protein
LVLGLNLSSKQLVDTKYDMTLRFRFSTANYNFISAQTISMSTEYKY